MTNPTLPAFKSRAFLCGADMNPISIRERWPEARFVGIARADGLLTRMVGFEANAFGPDLWGILVDVGEVLNGLPLPVTLRDGTAATAMITRETEGFGSLSDLLVEANYWELPVVYRDRIKQVMDRS